MIYYTYELATSELSPTVKIQTSERRVASPRRREGLSAILDRPLISVVVPVYQEEKLLRSTLEVLTGSLREQFDYELIVSDGGSTDSTVAIAEEFADKIVLHELDRRQTIAEGRNAGAAVAEGDIIVFINGDTLPADPPAFFADVIQWSTQPNRDGTVALACAVRVAPHERTIGDRMFHAFFNSYVRLLNFVGLGMGRGECQIVRTWAFRMVGGYNPAISAGEDFDLFRRLARIGRIGQRAAGLVYESPRRFRKYGYARILAEWCINAVSVMIRKKAVSDEWEAVR